jgi:two-component system OmpR family response regulator
MNTRKPKVLLVDDEESFTKVTQLTLTDYEIQVENDSSRALAAARSFHPDLILLDVMMPNFDGGDVAAQIRADPDLKEVPVVFLTALVTQKESARRPILGGYPFIAKPVTPERLAENIEKYLGNTKP